MLERALTGALVSVGRTVERAAGVVGRALPSKPAGRPKASRGRAPGRRPGSVEARRVRGVRRVTAVPGVAIHGPVVPRHAEILTNEALAFIAALHRRLEARRRELLSISGDNEAFASTPADLIDRRVEAADPAALVDFQAVEAPSWSNLIAGQLRLKDGGLVLRPRGWQLSEEHLTVDGQPVCAALFDVGLYAFHGAQATLAQGATPRVALPEGEAQRDAPLWSELLQFAEAALGLGAGTIKTVSAPRA